MKIALTVIFGGPDSEIVQPVTTGLKKKLKALEPLRHSKDLDSIRLRLGVSGSIDSFREPSGCTGFRVAKKSRYASAELTVHQDVWRKGEQHVAAYLDQLVLEAVSELTRRCEKAGVQIESERLLRDLQNALGATGTSRER